MNYKESKKILEKIKKAKRILITCHHRPDPDSVGSVIATYLILTKMGKKADLVSPMDIPNYLHFLPHLEKIRTVDFKKFDFTRYDLFLALDASTWGQLTGIKDLPKPSSLYIIQIDHHPKSGGKAYGDLILINDKASSTSEVLYSLSEDWGVKIDKAIAHYLLTGIHGDTMSFTTDKVSPKTLKVASELMSAGGDAQEIVFNFSFSLEYDYLKILGKILQNLQIDGNRRKFVWSAISNNVYKKFGSPEASKNLAANMIAGRVKGTDFGVILVEEEKDNLSLSFRSRTDFDVAKLATALGGGGHKGSSGASVRGLPFNQAVEKVLGVCRKFAKANKSS